MSTEFITIFWIVVAVVALIALIVHTLIVEDDTFELFDIFDTFLDDFGWVTVFVCFAIGGIVFGFITWIWWAMLLITIFTVIVAVVIGCIAYSKYKKYKQEEEKEEAEDKKEQIVQTNHECKNCGAKLIKRIYVDEKGKKKIEYRCDYCKTVFDGNELSGHSKTEQDKDVHDLDDWEEEYFEVCVLLGFKPQDSHTEKQIDRKIEKLEEMYDSGSLSYEGDLDPEDALEIAGDFFFDNMDEIEEYLKRYSKEEIKKRFEHYLSLDKNK